MLNKRLLVRKKIFNEKLILIVTVIFVYHVFYILCINNWNKIVAESWRLFAATKTKTKNATTTVKPSDYLAIQGLLEAEYNEIEARH